MSSNTFYSSINQNMLKILFIQVQGYPQRWAFRKTVWFLMFMIPATHAPQLYIWIYELGQPLQSYIKLYRQFSNTKVAEDCAL